MILKDAVGAALQEQQRLSRCGLKRPSSEQSDDMPDKD